MKTDLQSKNHFADALGTALHYAVLTKRGRVQILVTPSAKELRRRGKREWRLFGMVEGNDDAELTLMEMVQRAIQEIESARGTADNEKKSKGAEFEAGIKGRKRKR
jgi:hypothetical protein